jgi:Protein of unknown function (DUF2800)
MKRECWYQGLVILQDDDDGRWRSHGTRKPLPGETADQFPKLLMTTETPAEQYQRILSRLNPEERSEWDGIVERTEAGGNDGADVCEAEELWKTFQDKYPMTIETPPAGLSGSHNSHARLSPSDSKRWSNCTAAIAFQEANAHRVRKDDSSPDADEGTEAHDWAAKVLMGECLLDEVPETGMRGAGLREFVAIYVEHCMEQVGKATRSSIAGCIEDADLGIDPPEHVYFVEEQVQLFYGSEKPGTADFIGVVTERGVVKRFVGRDYKHGAGVLVTNQDNTQLVSYVYSAIKLLEGIYEFGPETLVDLAVFQPRHREAADITPWVLPLADLAKFCTELEYKAIQAREAANRVRAKIGAPGRDVSPEEILEAAPGSVFAPSEGDGGACRWCKCKAFCGKRLAALTLDMDFPDVSAFELLAEMPELDKEESKLPVAERIKAVSERLGVGVLTDEYLVRYFASSKGRKKFDADVEEYLEGRVLDGENIPGVKLAEGGPGDRKWADEDAADTFLKGQGLKEKERYKFQLLGPAPIEKLLKTNLKVKRTKSRFESLITRAPGKMKLVLADDKRDAVAAPISEMPTLDADDDFEV